MWIVHLRYHHILVRLYFTFLFKLCFIRMEQIEKIKFLKLFLKSSFMKCHPFVAFRHYSFQLRILLKIVKVPNPREFRIDKVMGIRNEHWHLCRPLYIELSVLIFQCKEGARGVNIHWRTHINYKHVLSEMTSRYYV